MRLSRTAAVAGAALMLGGLGATAYAAGTTTLASSTAPTSNITVTWSGLALPANSTPAVFITQCQKNDSGPFVPSIDCSNANGRNPVFVTNGSTTFPAFNGDEPINGEWGCGPLASAATLSAQCYIRLAPGGATNTASDEFIPLNYGTEPPVEIPEVPLNVLLPAGAAAILGAAMFINRKRQSANV